MIVIRFGRWRRQWRGKYDYRRVYLWGLPLPLCRRLPREDRKGHRDIGIVRTAAMRIDSVWEKRKGKG